jgi:hypothetical protein
MRRSLGTIAVPVAAFFSLLASVPLAVGVALWAAAAAGLTLSFAGEVVDFAGVHVENDLSSPCVRVTNDDLGSVALFDFLSG